MLNNGALKCWGENGHYEKLDGTTVDVKTPTALPGMSSGVTSFENGFNFSCAVVNGGVKCWGVNAAGQLGDGTTTTRTTPVDVVGLTSGVSKVVAGLNHACALLTSGGVQCWGDNSDGELGRGFADGVGGYRATADWVSGLTSGVSDIATGSVKAEHTCAIISGGVKCWGYNAWGNLGDGTSTARSVPTAVVGIGTAGSGVLKLAPSRYTTCVLLTGSVVKCWGMNDLGQLGNSNLGVNSSSPVTMDLSSLAGGDSVTDLGLGEDQGCLLTGAGAVYCWGSDSVGQLADGTVGGANKAKPMATLVTSGATQISVGRYHACTMNSSNALQCWGYNAFGQLGQGNTTNSPTPLAVSY